MEQTSYMPAIQCKNRIQDDSQALKAYLQTPIPAGQPRLHPITVDTYHRMGEAGLLNGRQRTELIEASIIDMSPIGCEHADWVDRLTRLFIRRLPDEIVVRVQNPVRLDQTNEPEPDIALLRPRAQPYREAHPRPEDILLIVEVADTSLRYDQEVKCPLYARCGIPEVWVIDVASDRLNVYREPDAGEYRIHRRPRRDETLKLWALPNIAIDLRWLFS